MISNNCERKRQINGPQNSDFANQLVLPSNHVWGGEGKGKWGESGKNKGVTIPFKAHLLLLLRRRRYNLLTASLRPPIVLETHECIFYCQNMAWCLQVKVEAMFWVNCSGEAEGSLWLSKPEGIQAKPSAAVAAAGHNISPQVPLHLYSHPAHPSHSN